MPSRGVGLLCTPKPKLSDARAVDTASVVVVAKPIARVRCCRPARPVSAVWPVCTTFPGWSAVYVQSIW